MRARFRLDGTSGSPEVDGLGASLANRYVEFCIIGSASGLGKRARRNPGTAPSAGSSVAKTRSRRSVTAWLSAPTPRPKAFGSRFLLTPLTNTAYISVGWLVG